MTIYIEDLSRNILTSFTLFPSTPMGKVIAACSLKFSVEVEDIRLIWEGFKIGNKSTPSSLGLEDGARVVWYPRNDGDELLVPLPDSQCDGSFR